MHSCRYIVRTKKNVYGTLGILAPKICPDLNLGHIRQYNTLQCVIFAPNTEQYQWKSFGHLRENSLKNVGEK